MKEYRIDKEEKIDNLSWEEQRIRMMQASTTINLIASLICGEDKDNLYEQVKSNFNYIYGEENLPSLEDIRKIYTNSLMQAEKFIKENNLDR